MQCRSIALTLLDTVTAAKNHRPRAEFFPFYADVLDEVAAAFAALGDDVSGTDEAENVRSAVRKGGDKWRDLRGRIQTAEVRQGDRPLSYGSLLVDAERIRDELERAQDSLAASTP